MPQEFFIHVLCPQCGTILTVNRFDEGAVCVKCDLHWTIQDEDIVFIERYEKERVIREKVMLT